MAVAARLCILLLAVTAAGTFLGGVEGEDFHPERTRLMDVYPSASPQNFLFRGNMPAVNGSFAYSQIMTKMKSIVQQEGHTVPAQPYLIVVSYLNPFEEKDLEIERKFFQRNESLGRLENTIVTGSTTAPPNDNTTLDKDLVRAFADVSVLPKLTKHLHDLLQQSKSPSFLYTHCEAGTDRTGEVSGAYYIRYLNQSFSAALYTDNHIQNRDMYKTSRNAMQWYCYYLHYFEGYHQLNCTVPDTVK